MSGTPLIRGFAFVTGGARGLGNAVGMAFAREGAEGVALIDIQDEKTFAAGKANVEAFGVKCLTINVDVTKEDQVEAAVAEVVREFGRIDFAANFAGTNRPLTPIVNTELAAWNKAFSVNITGVMLCNKFQLRQMMKQDPTAALRSGSFVQKGSIVNCASINSLVAMPGTGAYSASKHAVTGLTKAAALEGRRHNIRVNSISPGFILTQMNKDFVENNEAGAALWKKFESRQGRAALPEEVAEAVVMLSSPRMSLVNGHNLIVDNGYSVNQSDGENDPDFPF